MNTMSNNRSSDDESNTTEQEHDVYELSDREIQAADKVLLNFRLHKVDRRAEYPSTGLPPAQTKLDIFNGLIFLNPDEIYQQLGKRQRSKQIWIGYMHG